MGLFDKLTKGAVNWIGVAVGFIIFAYLGLVITDFVASKANPNSDYSIKIGAAKDFLNTIIVTALAISVFITSGGAVGLKTKIENAASEIIPSSKTPPPPTATPTATPTEYY